MSGAVSVPAQYQPLVASASQQYGVPYGVLAWQLQQESSWNPDAQNGDAEGIAQFIPSTASQFGIDPLNPSQAIPAAAQYDAQLFGQSGSWQQALAGYGTAPLGSTAASNFASYESAQGINDAMASGGGSPGLTTFGGAVADASNPIGALTGWLTGLGTNLFGGTSNAGSPSSPGSAVYEFFTRAGLVGVALALLVGGAYLAAHEQAKASP